MPEAIIGGNQCPIALDPMEIGFCAKLFEGAVMESGSGTGELPQMNDSFSWRAGGDDWNYRLACEGSPETVHEDGFTFTLDRWTLERRAVDSSESDRVYYFDPVASSLEVMRSGARYDASFHETYDFWWACMDLQAEINTRRQQYPYRLIGGMLIENERED